MSAPGAIQGGAADAATPSAQPSAVLRRCGYCSQWVARPCGDGCHASPSDPTWELLVAPRQEASPDLYEALRETWRVLHAAGLSNLVRGVQLGQTSWYVKISDAEAMSKAALAKAEGN